MEGCRGLSKSFTTRVIFGVTPFRVLTTLLITYLLSPLPLQVDPEPQTLKPQTLNPKSWTLDPTWRGRGLSKSFITRVIIGVTPFRVLTALLITYLLSPLPLQVDPEPQTPKPQTLNPKSWTLDPMTLNPKPLNPKP